ncbi:MAG: hypothetical protein K8R68_09960 [Bacteroidales bacterium]|nr:hypothetical protein [Bacteroidales bacterium]
MKDFTLTSYKQLLQALISKDYNFFTVEEYFTLTPSSLRILREGGSPSRLVANLPSRQFATSQPRNLIIMRHDVDRKPNNALRMAKLENELGIKATYYFRIIPQTFKPEIIKEIAELGHEIGYHYENLSEIASRNNFRKSKKQKSKSKKKKENNHNLFELAIKDFEKNLSRLREIYPVKTICMHGSPMSKWDSRLLWEKYNYKDYGIISEPYFDIDYNAVFYITDTGRQWNNSKISIRDKVETKYEIKIKDTKDIIDKVNSKQLPNKIMINVHPHRWFDFGFNWVKELIFQNIKNIVKLIIIRNG